jgi:hypothetical protein
MGRRRPRPGGMQPCAGVRCSPPNAGRPDALVRSGPPACSPMIFARFMSVRLVYSVDANSSSTRPRDHSPPGRPGQRSLSGQVSVAGRPVLPRHESLESHSDRSRRLLRRIREIGSYEPYEMIGDDLVHTDFMVPNILFDETGQITAWSTGELRAVIASSAWSSSSLISPGTLPPPTAVSRM